MKLKPLSQMVLAQTLQKHNDELQHLVALLKDNDQAPTSALLDLQSMEWVVSRSNDATGVSVE